MNRFEPGIESRAALLPIVLMVVCVGLSTHPAQATVIKELRVGGEDEAVRLVLEVDRAFARLPSVAIHGKAMNVTLAGALPPLPAIPAIDRHDGLVGLDISRSSEGVRIDAVFAFEPAVVNSFALTDPHRFIVDTYRTAASADAGMATTNAVQEAFGNATSSLPRSPDVPQPPATISTPADRAGRNAHGSEPSKTRDAVETDPIQTQQRLLASLIVVTSIMVALLFVLVWRGGIRKTARRERRVMAALPPARDPDIEKIDMAIMEYFRIYDRL